MLHNYTNGCDVCLFTDDEYLALLEPAGAASGCCAMNSTPNRRPRQLPAHLRQLQRAPASITVLVDVVPLKLALTKPPAPIPPGRTPLDLHSEQTPLLPATQLPDQSSSSPEPFEEPLYDERQWWRWCCERHVTYKECYNYPQITWICWTFARGRLDEQCKILHDGPSAVLEENQQVRKEKQQFEKDRKRLHDRLGAVWGEHQQATNEKQRLDEVLTGIRRDASTALG